MFGRPCFEVEFSDGEVIVADAEHQWLTGRRRRASGTSRRRCGRRRAGPPDRRIAARSPTTARRSAGPPRSSRPACTAAAELNHADAPRAVRSRCPSGSCRSTRAALGLPARRRRLAVSGRVVSRPSDREWAMKEFDRLGYRRACGGRGRPVRGARAAATRGCELGVHQQARARGLPAGFGRAARRALLAGLMEADGRRGCTRQVPLAHHRRRLAGGSASCCRPRLRPRLYRRYLSHEGQSTVRPMWRRSSSGPRTGLPAGPQRMFASAAPGTATTRVTTSSMCGQCRACRFVACRSTTPTSYTSPGGR